MSILATIRTFFNPGAPAIQTRDEMLALEQRSVVGLSLYATHQIGKPIWEPGTRQRYVSEGWSKSPVVFACVLAIADSVATAPLVAVEMNRNGELEPAPQSDLQRLLDRPNPSMDQAEFMQTVASMGALSGFTVIEKERNGLGKVVALWPLRSDWVKPIPRDQSAPAWEYRVPGRRDPFILEPEDVIVHTHAPDPNMGYLGTAPMSVAFRELGIENAMTDYLKAFFDHGAMPQHGLKTTQRFQTQEEADAFRQRVVGRYAGLRNSADPMLLQGIEDVVRLGFNFDELAYPQLRSLSETNICTAFRVPPILIGIQAGLDASTYSNYGQARKAFYEDTIMSLWRRLDGALTRSLVPEFDTTGKLTVMFDTGAVSALQDDEDALWQRTTAAAQAGLISTHTFQRLVGLDPHGPDVIYQPFSVTPVPVTLPRSARKSVTGVLTRIEPKALPVGQRSVRTIPYDSDEHHARWEKRLTLTTHWEQQFATALAAVMEEQRQDVLDVLAGGGRAVREIAVADPFDKDKWIKAFKLTMKPVVQNIVNDQAGLALNELGVSVAFDVQDPNVIRAMEKQLQRFATEVNDTTWDALKATLAEGVDAGEGIGQLAERVEAVMVDRIKSSKETIARTEVTASSTVGTQESWRQSGVVTGKEWIAALDNRTRESHVHAHGQVVGIDENFSVGGATGPGPGMMSSAAESVNCRCSMAPVLDTDMEG